MPTNCEHKATSLGFLGFSFPSTFMLGFLFAMSYKSTQVLSQKCFFKKIYKLRPQWKEHNLHFILQGEAKGLADLQKYN